MMQNAENKQTAWNNARFQTLLIWVAAVMMAIGVALTFVSVQSAKMWDMEVRANKSITN